MGHWKDIMLRGAVIPLQQMAMFREQVAVLRGSLSSEDRARHELVRFGALLDENRCVAATDGNLSVRLEQGRAMITPSGFSRGMMKPEDMVVVDLAGGQRKCTQHAK